MARGRRWKAHAFAGPCWRYRCLHDEPRMPLGCFRLSWNRCRIRRPHPRPLNQTLKRVEALRAAFAATMRDPALVAAAERNMEVGMAPHDQVEKVVADLLSSVPTRAAPVPTATASISLRAVSRRRDPLARNVNPSSATTSAVSGAQLRRGPGGMCQQSRQRRQLADVVAAHAGPTWSDARCGGGRIRASESTKTPHAAPVQLNVQRGVGAGR